MTNKLIRAIEELFAIHTKIPSPLSAWIHPVERENDETVKHKMTGIFLDEWARLVFITAKSLHSVGFPRNASPFDPPRTENTNIHLHTQHPSQIRLSINCSHLPIHPTDKKQILAQRNIICQFLFSSFFPSSHCSFFLCHSFAFLLTSPPPSFAFDSSFFFRDVSHFLTLIGLIIA